MNADAFAQGVREYHSCDDQAVQADMQPPLRSEAFLSAGLHAKISRDKSSYTGLSTELFISHGTIFMVDLYYGSLEVVSGTV